MAAGCADSEWSVKFERWPKLVWPKAIVRRGKAVYQRAHPIDAGREDPPVYVADPHDNLH
jgi:hypothetical protein